MLTEQRYEIILGLLREKNSVTVTELKDILNASESTVRRDITALYKAGKLTRVFGGAVALEHTVNAYEPTVAQKSELNIEEKKKIAAYAASLIQPEDFVYLDAGTTTGYMLEHLNGSRATFVTNGVSHASDPGPDGNPCAADRRGVERLHGSGDRKPGHADAEELSFYQGLFWNQRNDPERRLYHTGGQ